MRHKCRHTIILILWPSPYLTIPSLYTSICSSMSFLWVPPSSKCCSMVFKILIMVIFIMVIVKFQIKFKLLPRISQPLADTNQLLFFTWREIVQLVNHSLLFGQFKTLTPSIYISSCFSNSKTIHRQHLYSEAPSWSRNEQSKILSYLWI